MLNTRFGTEIEFTGITRNEAAKVVAKQLNGTVRHAGGSYDAYHITAPDRRVWKVMFDSSIAAQKTIDGPILPQRRGEKNIYKCAQPHNHQELHPYHLRTQRPFLQGFEH